MNRSDITVPVDHLEDDLLKVRDLAVILNDQMLSVNGITVPVCHALSHLTSDIVQLADRMREHISAAFDAARAEPAETAAIPSKFGEPVPAVEELSLPDLLAAGMALLPIAEALSAAWNRSDLSEAVLGFILPLRETIDDALHAIIEHVEDARPTAMDEVCNRSRLLLGNAHYRDEDSSYVAELAGRLAQDEARAR